MRSDSCAVTAGLMSTDFVSYLSFDKPISAGLKPRPSDFKLCRELGMPPCNFPRAWTFMRQSYRLPFINLTSRTYLTLQLRVDSDQVPSPVADVS